VPPGAADLTRIPDALARDCRYRPKRGPASSCVGATDRKVDQPFLLFDIVEERKRNAGGACPGGSCGQPQGQPKHRSFAFIQKPSFDGDIESTWFLVNVRNAIIVGIRKNIGELFQT
jgi:hypothetical protein